MYQPGDLLEPTFRFLYGNNRFDVRVCDPGSESGTTRRFNCTIDSHHVHFIDAVGLPSIDYPLSATIAFEYTGEDHIRLLTVLPDGPSDYNPKAIADAHAALPLHVKTILARWPFEPQTPLNEHPVQYVTLNQNSMVWLLDLPTPPVPSYGWHGNWVTSTHGTLDLWLDPGHGYLLKAKISNSTVPDTLKNITLSVNGETIPMTTQVDANNSMSLQATIPIEVVAKDTKQTLVTFQSSPVTSPAAAQTGTDDHLSHFRWIS